MRCAAVLLLLATTCATLCGETAKEALTRDFKGKTVYLRQPFCGTELHFDADGNPVMPKSIGPWTLCGRLKIDSFSTEKGQLVVYGTRDLLEYNQQSKKLQDVEEGFQDPAMTAMSGNQLEWLKGVRERLDKLRPLKVFFGDANNGADRARALMEKLFAPEDQLDSILPDYWKDAFGGKIGTDIAPMPNLQKVGPGVKAPRPIEDKDPEYSDVARAAKYQGGLVLWVVIDESGTPSLIRVVRPLGLGLDEQALKAVSRWKFEPAEKNGKPVPVQVNIEVDFRLY